MPRAITPDEFDEVAAELGRSLGHFGVATREKDEVLEALLHIRRK
jgi:hypothetical protein